MLAQGFCGIEVAMTCGRVGSGLNLPFWVKVLWPFLDAWDSQCASTHSLHAVERPREVRAVWRALLLPYEERAEGLQ